MVEQYLCPRENRQDRRRTHAACIVSEIREQVYQTQFEGRRRSARDLLEQYNELRSNIIELHFSFDKSLNAKQLFNGNMCPITQFFEHINNI